MDRGRVKILLTANKTETKALMMSNEMAGGDCANTICAPVRFTDDSDQMIEPLRAKLPPINHLMTNCISHL